MDMWPEKQFWTDFFRQEKEDGELRSWSEALVFTGVILLLCFEFRPGDPFFLSSHFPWPWLVPIHIALRHGSKSGVISSVTLVIGWAIFRLGHPQSEGMHPGFFLGGFIATLSCGEFRDLWNFHIHRERKAKELIENRFDSLTRAHHVLQLSHDRLQGAFLAHPPTLRDALTEICGYRLSRLTAEPSQIFLAMLARFFQLEVGALYLMNNGFPVSEAVASLGPMHPLEAKDPLVAACLENGELCHALVEDGTFLRSPYLLVAPLVTVTGETLAILAVEKMPFFAFNEGNLKAVYSVMGYYADRIRTSQLATKVTAQFPDCPEDFAADYLRLHRLSRSSGLDVSLAALVLPTGRGFFEDRDSAELITIMRGRGRNLDQFWVRPLAGSRLALLALLPLCGEIQAMAYITRIGDLVQEGMQTKHDVSKAVKLLNKGDALENLLNFFQGLEISSRNRASIHG